MYKHIRCTDCYKYFLYPEEWTNYNPRDGAYLEDDFRCEHCQSVKDQDHYRQNGLAELNDY